MPSGWRGVVVGPLAAERRLPVGSWQPSQMSEYTHAQPANGAGAPPPPPPPQPLASRVLEAVCIADVNGVHPSDVRYCHAIMNMPRMLDMRVT